MANERKGARKPRREKKNVPFAIANIHATFNNTIVTFTDPTGNTLCWSSGGRAEQCLSTRRGTFGTMRRRQKFPPTASRRK